MKLKPASKHDISLSVSLSRRKKIKSVISTVKVISGYLNTTNYTLKVPQPLHHESGVSAEPKKAPPFPLKNNIFPPAHSCSHQHLKPPAISSH